MMKKRICAALLALMVCIASIAFAEDIPEAPVIELGPVDLTDDDLIEETEDFFGEIATGEAVDATIVLDDTFPDPFFHEYVMENFDKNGDGRISSDEAKKVKTIDVSGMGIFDLKGIELFTKLTTLDCSYNDLYELNLTANKSLTTLICDHNDLVGLELGKNSKLMSYVKSIVPKKDGGSVYYEKRSSKTWNTVLSIPDECEILNSDKTYFDPRDEVSLVIEDVIVGEKQKFELLDEDCQIPTSYLKFETSNKKIATVSKTGLVTPSKAGEATITVTSYDGQVYTCDVTVVKAPSKVTLPVKKLELCVDQDYFLEASVPEEYVSVFTWKSSKPKVAEVDDGYVTALEPGKATITVRTYNGKSASCSVTVYPQPTSISLNVEKLGLMEKQTYPLKVTLNKGAGGNVDLYSEDPGIAEVDNDTGVITAVKMGTTTIWAETYNGLRASCEVTVKPGPKAIELDEDSILMLVGETWDLGVTALSEDGLDVSDILEYKSSNAKVVSVSADGELKALKSGSATITVSAANGKKATCQVTVGKAPTSISLNKTTLKLKYNSDEDEGETAQLKATLNSGAISEITFESDDEDVAIVDDDGLVIAVGIGKTTITAWTSNGKKATCAVTVVEGAKPQQPSHDGVIVVAHRGGLSCGPENTLEAFGNSAAYGADMIELDVRPTKDGVLVINHDPKISGKTIKKTSYEDLVKKKSDLCTLDEALDVIYDSGLLLQVELKDSLDNSDVTDIVRKVRAHDMEDRVIYISFEKDLLRQVRKVEPSAKLGFIFMDHVPSKLDSFIDEIDISALMVHYKLLTQSRLDNWHDKGLLVNVWTINTYSECKSWIDMGVDFITSNYPELADRARS